ncbi:FUSC family protein [Brevibacillus dissolubilis]|uniref:FUSC family protein n=1 Tax=Brevibacillus dissolubilis TaxID=1844116 RepID=UPI0011172994|nr:FUSC family protein [Brevibacillus dissolubilis]
MSTYADDTVQVEGNVASVKLKGAGEKLLTLLAGVTGNEAKIARFLEERIKGSRNYSTVQKIHDCELFSQKAHELASEIQQFTYECQTMAEAKDLERKLKKYAEKLKSLEQTSIDRINNNNYNLELLSRQKVEELQKKQTKYKKILKLLTENKHREPGVLLREQLLKDYDADLEIAYKATRTKKQEKEDRELYDRIVSISTCAGIIIAILICWLPPDGYFEVMGSIIWWVWGILMVLLLIATGPVAIIPALLTLLILVYYTDILVWVITIPILGFLGHFIGIGIASNSRRVPL